jgi:mRNA interferase MazF
MRRGDLVTIALQGADGKPRPALVIQSDLFDAHPSIAVLPITSELRDAPLFRIRVEPSPGNGLRQLSDVMAVNPQTVPRDKVGEAIGRLPDDTMLRVNRALALFPGFA